ncbi:hypothetical protein KIL84_011055 [Mauremys mutica]|uniref:Uncharacterized protein n=1 Tax=Mauremys mutica TaxID=74926 RepID=A0A9D3XDJ6_9SAUR|nr:hypothetical protein KIL84_011055 [Mauremys mutica]
MRTAPVLCDVSSGAVGVPKCLGQRAALWTPHPSGKERPPPPSSWYALPHSARIARAPPLPRGEIPRTVELGRSGAEFCPEEVGAPASLGAGTDSLVCLFPELPLRRRSCVPSFTLLSLPPSLPQLAGRRSSGQPVRPEAGGVSGCLLLPVRGLFAWLRRELPPAPASKAVLACALVRCD